MGAAREGRESEKTLTQIWGLIPHLQVTVWSPLEEDAIELSTDIMIKMAKLIEQLKDQQREKQNAVYKNMNKTIVEPIKSKEDGV